LIAGPRPGGKRAADELLGCAIGLGGVDEGHALLEGVMERFDGVAVVDGAQAATDRPCTEADDRDKWAVTAKLALLHAVHRRAAPEPRCRKTSPGRARRR